MKHKYELYRFSSYPYFTDEELIGSFSSYEEAEIELDRHLSINLTNPYDNSTGFYIKTI